MSWVAILVFGGGLTLAVTVTLLAGWALGRQDMNRPISKAEYRRIREQLEREYRGKVPQHEIDALKERVQ